MPDPKVNEDFSAIPSPEIIKQTAEALRQNGITVFITENKEEAKKKVFEILPVNSEIMTMSSVTVAETGIEKEILESGKFNPVKKKLLAMDRKTQEKEMKVLGAAADWSIGSVHAVTQNGHLFIASLTGSQMPAYSYASEKVIFVVGVQKIVKDFDQAIKRIYEYTLPLEDQRALKAYNIHSSVNKMLIINKEIVPGRLTLVFIKENIGF